MHPVVLPVAIPITVGIMEQPDTLAVHPVVLPVAITITGRLPVRA